jgi:hypothetical protein
MLPVEEEECSVYLRNTLGCFKKDLSVCRNHNKVVSAHKDMDTTIIITQNMDITIIRNLRYKAQTYLLGHGYCCWLLQAQLSINQARGRKDRHLGERCTRRDSQSLRVLPNLVPNLGEDRIPDGWPHCTLGSGN